MRHQESKIFPYSCDLVFAVVVDVENYPQFLPGWSRVRILHSDDNRLEVEQQLHLGLFRIRFHSIAQFERCRRVMITSSDAPFGTMNIEWQFTPRNGNRCEVSLMMELALHGGPLKQPLQQLLKYSGEGLLRQFENRIQELHGTRTRA